MAQIGYPVIMFKKILFLIPRLNDGDCTNIGIVSYYKQL